MKLFCLACPRCKISSTRALGFCEIKKIYIYDPFKNCTVGFNSEYTKEMKGKNVLEWLDDSIQMDHDRKLAVMKWRSMMGWDEE